MTGEPIDRARQIRFWLLALLGFLLVIYLLRAMLLPFVAGMAVAYFLDPVCDRLQRLGCTRVWATTIVSICFILVLVLAILLILPTLQSQIMSFAQRLPGYLDRLLNTVWPELQKLGARLGIESLADLRSQASGMVGGIVAWVGGALAGLVTSGVALANLLSLLFITPVVAFYLLRDWDRLKRETDSLLPERHAATEDGGPHGVGDGDVDAAQDDEHQRERRGIADHDQADQDAMVAPIEDVDEAAIDEAQTVF